MPKIITSHYVRIDQDPAPLSNRIWAVVIDIALLFACEILLFFLVEESKGLPDWFVITVFVTPLLSYNVLMETFFHGQTVGKMMLKTRVTMVDGSSPGLSAFLLRWLLYPVDIMFFGCVGLFSMLVTQHRQRLGDLAAGTMVVKLEQYNRRRISLDEFNFVDSDYQPMYQQARQLTEADVELLRHALADRSFSRSDRIRELAIALATKLGIPDDDWVGYHTNESFVAQVASDWGYYDLNDIG